MMLFGERARFWRDAMSARITAQPELTTTALDVGQMDLAAIHRFSVLRATCRDACSLIQTDC